MAYQTGAKATISEYPCRSLCARSWMSGARQYHPVHREGWSGQVLCVEAHRSFGMMLATSEVQLEPAPMPYGVTRLAIIHGRAAGTLRLSDGTLLSNLYWNHLFKDYPEVRQFQIVLRANGSIEAQLVGKGFGSAREQALQNALGSIGLRAKFTIRWVAAIHRTREGKLIQVRKETEPEAPIS